LELAKYISIFFIASFSGGFPPGLVNMSVAKIALQKGKRNAYISAFGACLANFLQVMIGILLAKYVIKYANIQANVLKIGVFIFAALTVYFLYVAIKNKPIDTNADQRKSKKNFFKGFFISAINVLPIPYYIIISTQLSPDMRDFYSWPRLFMFSGAAVLATFLVLSSYITAFLKLHERSNSLVKYANLIMAILMFAIFVITLLRLLNV